MNLNVEQLRILRHMLGINDGGKKPIPYRDYYCATPNNACLLDMAAIGAVFMYAKHGGYQWFACTSDGRAAAIESHKTIAWPKSKRVYSAYLSARDVIRGLTFRKFITDPIFYDARKNA